MLFVMLPQIATAQAVRLVIAFVDVNVLTMTDERVSDGQTVVVQDGRVVSLDLLLVSGNPLRDLSVLKPEGVMARGRWIPRQELDSLLKRLH
jgi:hypothetical protein